MAVELNLRKRPVKIYWMVRGMIHDVSPHLSGGSVWDLAVMLILSFPLNGTIGFDTTCKDRRSTQPAGALEFLAIIQ
jgi:hypothetical protein